MLAQTLQARVAAYLGVAESDLHLVVVNPDGLNGDGEVVVLLNTYAKYRIPLSALPEAAADEAPQAEEPEQPAEPPPAKPKAATASKARRKPGL